MGNKLILNTESISISIKPLNELLLIKPYKKYDEFNEIKLIPIKPSEYSQYGLDPSLRKLVDEGLITEEDAWEITRQKIIFKENEQELKKKYKGKVVVVCDGKFFEGNNLTEAVKKAKEKVGEKPYYAESLYESLDIPSTLF
ncbi:hypothetical protein HRbin06_00142 [archaeon HR06]|nr:hypothetical protein HRbin06_00142 [archaeon HR06]